MTAKKKLRTKIEVRLSPELKAAAQTVAEHVGDGDLSAWIRTLMRRGIEKMTGARAPL